MVKTVMGELWDWYHYNTPFEHKGVRIGPRSEWVSFEICHHILDTGLEITLRDAHKTIIIYASSVSEIKSLMVIEAADGS